MNAWRAYTRASGLDVASWIVIGIAAVYLGYHMGPLAIERVMQWIS